MCILRNYSSETNALAPPDGGETALIEQDLSTMSACLLLFFRSFLTCLLMARRLWLLAFHTGRRTVHGYS